MAALSTYAANKLLDHIRGLTSFTMPSVWIGLCTTASSAAGQGTEAAYTGYARVSLSGLLAAASAGSGTNNAVINFPACTGGTSTIVGFFTADSATVSAGNLLEFGTCSLSVSSGITPSFPIGQFATTAA